MPRRPARERGLALLAVLWVGVALGALAGAAASLARSDIDLAHNARVRAEAELAADSAARLAIYALANASDTAIAADGAVTAWRIDGAEVRVEVTAEARRVDVNAASVAELAVVLIAAGADEAQAGRLAAAIVDFVDEDDLLTPEGAERPDYRAEGLPGPKNAPLEHEDELLGVVGMPPALYRRAADGLTVHGVAGGRRLLIDEPPPAAALSAVEAEPLPPAFVVALDGTPRVLRPGAAAAPSANLVRIRAEAATESGARAVRIAVVGLGAGRGTDTRAWRSGRSTLFPDETAGAAATAAPQ